MLHAASNVGKYLNIITVLAGLAGQYVYVMYVYILYKEKLFLEKTKTATTFSGNAVKELLLLLLCKYQSTLRS